MSDKPQDLNALLQEGIALARAGERAKAREIFETIVEQDERSEKAWFWLASVVETDEERKICLNNVLRLNPANERARTALTALESRQKEAVASEEVMPGISRRTFTLLIGGAVALVVVLLVVTLAVSANNARIEQERIAGETQAAFVITQSFETTGTAVIAATETQLAIATPTLPPTNTPNIATLPPTWTPVPTATTPPTAAAIPPPTGLNGVLLVWGGRDVLAVDFLDMGIYNFNTGGGYTRIPIDYVREPAFFPNGQLVTFVKYDDLLFDSILQAATLNGGSLETLTDRLAPFAQAVLNIASPSYSPDGRTVVFTGRAVGGSQNPQVFLLSLDPVPPPPPGAQPGDPSIVTPLRQLSRDDAIYSFPRMSPDGTRVVAVRQTDSGTDLVAFDIASGSFIPVTNDQNTTVETQPRWAAEGSQIVYAAAVATDPDNFDIYVRQSDGTGAPSLLVREPSAERYPVLSPDGRALAYASDRGGNWDIFVLTIATGETGQLTSAPEDEFPSDWWNTPGA